MRAAVFFAVFCAATRAAFGIIFLESGDPAKNTSTPGDNSGWQYEGQFGGFLGTPIAPRFFLTAAHIGGSVGQLFTFHGKTFKTVAAYADSETDLIIWKVDEDFPSYAPLWLSDLQIGLELRVFGRGTQRGSELTLNGELKGWNWGGGDGVQRWGSNIVALIVDDVSSADPPKKYLQADFDSPGVPNEAHLSVGDSGGAVFILNNGLWRLAAINYAVDDVYTDANAASRIIAAIFDARGYYVPNGSGGFSQLTGSQNIPTSFYSTRTSPRLAWITGITGTDPAVLAPEKFDDWRRCYFTPDQIGPQAVAEPTGDFDGDGIPNLLEFAFNLDPTFTEHVFMTAGSGIRGLPLIRLETDALNVSRLTVEFVRRKATSGSDITYEVQFTNDLTGTWNAGGTVDVTPINVRWDRVKVTDGVPATGERRFARVAVTQTAP